MRHFLRWWVPVAVLLLLADWSAGQEKTGDKPPARQQGAAGAARTIRAIPLLGPGASETSQAPADSPLGKYEALLREQRTMQLEWSRKYAQAKTDEEKQQLLKQRPNADSFIERMSALAKEHPNDAAAVKSLIWIVQYAPESAAATTALATLEEKYLGEANLIPELRRLSITAPSSRAFLKKAATQSSNSAVQLAAAGSLAQQLSQRAAMIRRYRTDERYQALAKQNAVYAKLLEEDPTPLEAEAVIYFRRLLDAQPSIDTLMAVVENCSDQQLVDRAIEVLVAQPTSVLELIARLPAIARSTNPGAEKLLRTLMEKSQLPDVQGAVCYYLAQLLAAKQERANTTGDSAEIEKLLDRVVREFPDVVVGREKAGVAADRQLFEIRYLSVGKTAPEIEAEDIDGATFKLSDYRGKVVMLDFWGHW